MTELQKVRVDKWLWAARFFKTRSMASKAVSGGHAHVNGARVKPASMVKVGDEVRVRRGDLEFQLVILKLSDRRGPASIARTLYEESEESIERRQRLRAEQRLVSGPAAGPARRPDKRDRRKIRKFLRRDE